MKSIYNDDESKRESNLLIASFMGKTIYPKKGDKEYKQWKGKACDYEWFEVLYNKSWDWLMPVVEKIETLGYDVQIEDNNCAIIGHDIDYSDYSTDKINAVYKAIVAFITHHNTNPS